MHNPRTAHQGPDLFEHGTPTVLSVRELTSNLRDVVESHFDDVWVEGELSNYRRYSSGHCYFTLKDEDAQIRAVMWRHYANFVFFEPRDGMSVRVHGSASFYEPRGDLQLVVKSMRLAGEGALQKAFNELKEKLNAEGLFSADHKRPLPRFPETVGIITSSDGAVLHDLLSILARRFPQVKVVVCPVRVQGLGAAEEIARALRLMSSLSPGDPQKPDVLVVGRGGGSLEDLWAFNEEGVARAIYESTVPVISAVGHETDFTISDFVADLRAATPSMAAEMVVPNRDDLLYQVQNLSGYLQDQICSRIKSFRQHIQLLTSSYAFNRPLDRLEREKHNLERLAERLERNIHVRLAQENGKFQALYDRLSLLNPRRPLQQGYVLIERNDVPIRNASDLNENDVVSMHFHDGRREARVIQDNTRR